MISYKVYKKDVLTNNYISYLCPGNFCIEVEGMTDRQMDDAGKDRTTQKEDGLEIRP